MSFGSMLTGLTEQQISFVVVGGVAAAAHGASRVTNGLDICYDAEASANVNALGELLAAWKAYPRGVEPGRPFIMDGKTLLGAPVMTVNSAEGNIDVMDHIAGVGPYELVRKHSEVMSAFGIDFRVLDLPSLIKATRTAGRPRDFDLLPELEALLAL
jgi:hypothetical protein